MKFIQLWPVEEWHTDTKLRGNGADVYDLPCTKIDREDFEGYHSVWFCKNIWARIVFLFTGKIGFAAMSNNHPPVIIGIGNFVEVNGHERE